MKKILFLLIIIAILPNASALSLIKHTLAYAGDISATHEFGKFQMPTHSGIFCKGYFCCGDGFCDLNEDSSNCPDDCPAVAEAEVDLGVTGERITEEIPIEIKKYLPYYILLIGAITVISISLFGRFLIIKRRKKKKPPEQSYIPVEF